MAGIVSDIAAAISIAEQVVASIRETNEAHKSFIPEAKSFNGECEITLRWINR